MRKVLPFLKEEYFSHQEDKVIFENISQFAIKYNKLPTIDALKTELEEVVGIPEGVYSEIEKKISSFKTDPPEVDIEWLIDKTETWCQERAMYNAVMESVSILEGNSKNQKHSIPDIMRDALSVSFDTKIGHHYFKNAKDRFEYYNKEESRLPFDIDILNTITGGGIKNKTLSIFIAGTGVGKSICLCHLAASYMAQKKNVLYITLEMSEEETTHRIDANLIGMDYQQVETLSKEKFFANIKKIYKKQYGELIVKEFPGGGATNAAHIRYLMRELEIKLNFKPDVLLIDYLGICGSARYKPGQGVNHSTYLKSVAEEIRALGQEFNIPVFSAAQFNREGMSNSDAALEDIAESIGITHTVDLALAIISSEELDQMGQYMFKQLKNRGNDMNKYKRFKVGVDKAQSKLINLTKYNEKANENDEIDQRVLRHTRKPKDFSAFKV